MAPVIRVIRVIRVLLACMLAAFAAPARAAPPDLSGLAFTPHPGARVPLDQAFVDDNGRTVRLGALLGGRPAVLAMGYYTCPNLCGVVRADLFAALAASGLHAPRDLAVLAVSIDPAETPAQAVAAKRDEAAQAATDPSGWHFLTGQSAAVAQSVGFPSRHDDRTAQYLHPAGLVVLTPGGVVSSYLLGVGYTGAQLREAVARAAAAGVAPAPAPLLLLCFHYDPLTGRYSLDVMRAVQAAGALTVLVLGIWLGVTHLRRRRPA